MTLDDVSGDVSPKDRFLTVYGRKPVLEALHDHDLQVDKVLLAEGTRGSVVEEIKEAAGARAVRVHRVTAHRVKVLAGNGRHDQGVLADVTAKRMRPLADAIADPAHAPRSVLLLDGLTTPANVGMILRTATASGIGGIVVPHHGVATLDPLVIKASAGVAFHAPVLRTQTAAEAAESLTEAGYSLYSLDSGAEQSLFDVDLGDRCAFVLGSESKGLSDEVHARIANRLAIPMRREVESLNVASAAAVLSFELLRRNIAA